MLRIAAGCGVRHKKTASGLMMASSSWLSKHNHCQGAGLSLVARFSSSPTMIPERSLWDTIYSGSKGMWSLIWSEESRQKFMDIIQGSVINADVLKQARFGNMLTMALFHDLQDPLFAKYSFDARDFLMGVQPALTNFHETIGQLQNELAPVTSQKDISERLMQRMQQVVASSMHQRSNKSRDGTSSGGSGDDEDGDNLVSGGFFFDNTWRGKAKEDPDSPAGRLMKMVTPKVFDSLFVATEGSATVSTFTEGSVKVSNVALLSARAMVMDLDDDEHESTFKSSTIAEDSFDDKDNKSNETQQKIESEKLDPDDEKEEPTKTFEESTTLNMQNDEEHVAAQIEVLYEMNQTREIKPEVLEEAGLSKDDIPPGAKEETQLWVGTFEGWLNGSPDGALRWRITSMRLPTSEFPGMFAHGSTL